MVIVARFVMCPEFLEPVIVEACEIRLGLVL